MKNNFFFTNLYMIFLSFLVFLLVKILYDTWNIDRKLYFGSFGLRKPTGIFWISLKLWKIVKKSPKIKKKIVLKAITNRKMRNKNYLGLKICVLLKHTWTLENIIYDGKEKRYKSHWRPYTYYMYLPYKNEK